MWLRGPGEPSTVGEVQLTHCRVTSCKRAAWCVGCPARRHLTTTLVKEAQTRGWDCGLQGNPLPEMSTSPMAVDSGPSCSTSVQLSAYSLGEHWRMAKVFWPVADREEAPGCWFRIS